MINIKQIILIISVLSMISCVTVKDVKPSRYLAETGSFVKEGYTVIDGVKIHYLEAGAGEPLVLIHGWTSWSGNWDEIIIRLKDNYHVYAIDLIGHGLSERVDDTTRYLTDYQAEMVGKFIKNIVGKPVFLIGHSMGGEISARTTLKHPDLVKKLVMVDAIGLEKNPGILPLLPGAGMNLGMESLVPALCSNGNIRWAMKEYMYYKSNPVDEFTYNGIIKYTFGTDNSRKEWAKITKIALFHDYIDDMVKDITVPTLLVWGRDDLVVPPELGKKYNMLIPQSRISIIPEAGHMVFEEKPEEFIAVVRPFLKE